MAVMLPRKKGFVVAVWLEDEDEKTLAIPSVWVELDAKGISCVRWPSTEPTISDIKSKRVPTKSWKRFILVSLGQESDSYDKCAELVSGTESQNEAAKNLDHIRKSKAGRENSKKTHGSRAIQHKTSRKTDNGANNKAIESQSESESSDDGNDDADSNVDLAHRKSPATADSSDDVDIITENASASLTLSYKEKCKQMPEGDFRWLTLLRISQLSKKVDTLIDLVERQPIVPLGDMGAVGCNDMLPPGGLQDREQLDALVESIKDDAKRSIVVQILQQSGSRNGELKQNVYAILKRLMDYNVSRFFNIMGTEMKENFLRNPLYEVVKEAVRKIHGPNVQDGDIKKHVGNNLKNCGTNFKRRDARMK